jgi:hypothetical protein
VAPVGGIEQPRPGEVDLLVVGAPTQRHGLPGAARDFLEDIPKGTLSGMRALPST